MTGLLLYEIILIGLGILMFLALLSILIVFAVQGKPFRGLLWFFVISVVMIAYPSFQSFRYKDWGVDFQKKAKELEANPKDTAAAKAITEQLEKIDLARVEDNAEILTTAAKAQEATGNLEKAAKNIEKAAKVKPQSKEVQKTQKEIQKKIEVKAKFNDDIRAINEGIKKIEKNPNDIQTVTEVKTQLNNVTIPEFVDPKDQITIANAHAVVGQSEEALRKLEEVTKVYPAIEVEAKKLKEHIISARHKMQIIPVTPSETPMNKKLVTPKVKRTN
jgi:tetratricopeptide (TPR) repeat protein